MSEYLKIAIIGGTGKEGKGLAYRWAKFGHKVTIGSRSEEKALSAAAELNDRFGSNLIQGTENNIAAEWADLIVLTVPFSAHAEMCNQIKPFATGKIVIDVTVPLVPPKVTVIQMPSEGSAGAQAQAIFGKDVFVVTAFQNISYEHLIDDDPVDCDVLVCGKKEAREAVVKLVEDAGLIGWSCGPIENSVVAEGLTSILITLNKQFGVKDAGIRITGIRK